MPVLLIRRGRKPTGSEPSIDRFGSRQVDRRGASAVHSTRPTRYGLEMHLATMYQQVTEFRPQVVVIDPISNFISAGSSSRSRGHAHPTRRFPQKSGDHELVHKPCPRLPRCHGNRRRDFLHHRYLAVAARHGTKRRTVRCAYVLKSRGMSHSKQVREFRLNDTGIDIGHVLFSVNPEREPARGGEA